MEQLYPPNQEEQQNPNHAQETMALRFQYDHHRHHRHHCHRATYTG